MPASRPLLTRGIVWHIQHGQSRLTDGTQNSDAKSRHDMGCMRCAATAAMEDVMLSVVHHTGRTLNNRAENAHRPVRERERWMQHFKNRFGTPSGLSACTGKF
jgi:hypothetical protein